MEIKLNLEVNLSQDTRNFILSILGNQKSAEVKESGTADKKKLKAVPAESTPASTAPVEDDKEVTLVTIKAKIISLRDAGKKEKTVALMQEYNCEKLSALPAEKYPEFMEKLNAIK
jgi:hypothetical protein